jgi:hypothetical protein
MAVFQKAERRKAKLKLALCGPSGSGKTYSALRIAKGMGGRIAFIDTENDSGQLYSGDFEYDIVAIAPPFSVDKYMSAIKAAEAEGYDILIIDSLTHAWNKQGGILDEVDKRSGNSNNKFTSGWREATPMHDKFIDTILQSPLHIIATMRAKTAYEIEKDEKGKSVPVKKGMEPIQRAGLEYEFTVVLDMDNYRHMATAGKDRTKLFDGQVFIPDEATGAALMQWLEQGSTSAPTYYQPQYQQQPVYPAYQQPEIQMPQVPISPQQELPFEAPAPTVQQFGFPQYEQEIVGIWTRAGWSIEGLAPWVQARYQGRNPNQLSTEECYAIVNEFTLYVNQKTGGQQA